MTAKKAIKKEDQKIDEKKEIQVIERIIENKAVAPSDAFGKLTASQITLIKRTIAKGASDDELRFFIQVCKGANLNPFLRQVFLVPRWDGKEGREVRTIQVSIDGFRAIAEESGAYAGNDDPVFGEEIEVVPGEKKPPIKVPTKATVTVYKVVEGQRYPFSATARWSEYYPGPKMGFRWHNMPFLMLGKCAEALALRKAFPKLLSGMYSAEELDKGQTESTEAEKTQKAVAMFKAAIDKCNTEELDELKSKLEKSAKYTSEEKIELSDLIDKRIELLTKASKPEEKKS